MKQTTNKQIIKVAKLFANTNSVLPQLECAMLTSDKITWSSLDIDITIPYKSGVSTLVPTKNLIAALEIMDNPSFKMVEKSKVSITEGKQVLKIGCDDISKYPVSITNRDLSKPLQLVGSLKESHIDILLDAVQFASNDDLRPSMTQILLSSHIVATDAHRLMYVALNDNAFSTAILFPPKAVKAMEIFGGDWTFCRGAIKDSVNIISVENSDGVVIGIMEVQALYPNWQAVVPELTDISPVAYFDTKELRQAIKTGSKFGNKYTKRSVLNLGEKSSFTTEDLDLDTEYSTEIQAENSEAIEIYVNWSFLDGVLAKAGDKVKMNYTTPTKPIIFDNKYLLMPIMR